MQKCFVENILLSSNLFNLYKWLHVILLNEILIWGFNKLQAIIITFIRHKDLKYLALREKTISHIMVSSVKLN